MQSTSCWAWAAFVALCGSSSVAAPCAGTEPGAHRIGDPCANDKAFVPINACVGVPRIGRGIDLRLHVLAGFRFAG